MLDYLSEIMLREYFTLDLIAGSFIPDKAFVFKRLGEVFLLPANKLETLFALTESPTVCGIRSEREYNLHCRIKQYYTLREKATDVKETLEETEALRVKGSVFQQLKRLEFFVGEDVTKTVVHKQLTDLANAGVVPMIRLLGFLKMEGVFVNRDVKSGFERLKNVAKWNDAEGLFYALRYEAGEKTQNLGRLKIAAENVSQPALFEIATQKYGEEYVAEDAQATLLEKAFRKGILRREVFSAQYARLIYSRTLEFKDKEKALFSGNKEQLALVTELPLKLSEEEFELHPSAMVDAPLARDAVAEKLYSALRNVDLRTLDSYKPLCLSSDSAYILDAYATTVAGLVDGAHVERIEVSDLTAPDFELTKNNVFISGCTEYKNNVYLLFFRGEIAPAVFEQVKNFLRSAKRRRFRLIHPAVCLDLSAVLPICFCDRENERLLKKYCDVTRISEATKAERKMVVDHILGEKRKQYGVPQITVCDEAIGQLTGLSIDAMESALDEAILSHRAKGQPLFLTAEIMKNCISEQNGARKYFGFGGEVSGN